MRCSDVLAGLLAAGLVGVAGHARGQISYVSRDSFIGYFEQDLDLLTSQLTVDESAAVGTNGFEDFNQLLVYPQGSTPWEETTAGQLSRLFPDAIEFDSRAFAHENVTGNAFGVYTAGARSSLTVVFDIAEAVPFQLIGDVFNASANNKPGTTTFSLTGPSVNINVSSGPLNEAGTLEPGRYTFDALVESIGEDRDDFTVNQRTRGEDLGFDALLLLGGGGLVNGDYSDSGLVEQGDLDQVLANWGQGFASIPATWINQRPTEGIVDQAELDVVLTEWGSSSAPGFAGSFGGTSGGAVPEPAAGVAVLIGAAALRRRTGVAPARRRGR